MKAFLAGVSFTCASFCLLIVSAWSSGANQSLDDYAQLLMNAPVFVDAAEADSTRSLMSRMMDAHHRRDGVAEVAELHDDYSYVLVTDEAVTTLAESRDMARQMTENLYQSDYMKNYQGVVATPIAIVGNIGIQLEVERFAFDDGETTKTTTLSIYETKDGKLLRLWAFRPATGPD